MTPLERIAVCRRHMERFPDPRSTPIDKAFYGVLLDIAEAAAQWCVGEADGEDLEEAVGRLAR